MIALVAFAVFVGLANASRVSRIIGGSIAKENSTPFMAEIQSFDGLQYNHKCGGAIIHPSFVLTAGHCLDGLKPKNVKILVGTNDLKNGKHFYQADKFIVHNR